MTPLVFTDADGPSRRPLWNKLQRPSLQGCIGGREKKTYNLFTVLFMQITLTNYISSHDHVN